MKVYLFLLVVVVYSGVSAQEKQWPPPGWADTSVHPGDVKHNTYQNLKGYLVLKNGDTLTGYMSLVYDRCQILEVGKFAPTIVYPQNIKYIRLDVESLGRNFTEIVTINVKHPKNAFWRVIKKKGNVIIYDRSHGVFSDKLWQEKIDTDMSRNDFNEYMVLTIKDSLVKIYGTFSLLSSQFGPKNRSKELILKFINQRYGQPVNETDFKTGMDMIDYILDKENEREAQEGVNK